MRKIFKDIKKILQAGDTFLITTHINPDGDGIGSAFAMDYLLKMLGKKTVIVCQDSVPHDFAFFGKEWIQYKEGIEIPSFHYVVVLDAPSLQRIGTVGKLIANTSNIINIDHHISNQSFGKWNIVDPHASSCSEILYTLFQEMNVSITQEVASFLYVAISTDTGSFRYQNITPMTHTIVAELIRTGVDVSALNEQLYSQVPVGKVKLFALLMNKVQLTCDGTIAWSVLTNEELAATGAQLSDADGFVNVLRDIEKVKIAFMVSNVQNPSVIKASLRSKGKYDVNTLAGSFNGGGHAKAAGCTIKGTVDEVVKKIIHKAKEQVVQE